MRIRKLILLASLGLALVVAPGVAMAKKADKTNNGKAPADIHGIGPGGVPALRDRLLGMIHELALRVGAAEARLDAAEGRLDGHDEAIAGLQDSVADLDSRLELIEGQFSDDDGDSFSEVQDDCDDTDPAVNPLAEEIPGNDVDEDCDHVVEPAAPPGQADAH